MTRSRPFVTTLFLIVLAASWLTAGAVGAAPAEPRPAAREGQRPEPPMLDASTTAAGDPQPVDINSAGVKELMTLSGIGHKVAEKIVEYREAHGPFKTAEDLRKVEGVGRGLFERNRERIVVK